MFSRGENRRLKILKDISAIFAVALGNASKLKSPNPHAHCMDSYEAYFSAIAGAISEIQLRTKKHPP